MMQTFSMTVHHQGTQSVVKGFIKIVILIKTYPDTDNTVSIFHFWKHIGQTPPYRVASGNPCT
jgi:hypothetical protein